MHSRVTKWALAVAGAGVLAASFALPAAAVEHHGKHHWRHHASYHHRYDRPWNVTARHRAPVVVAAPDPYTGPNAIVTAPNAVAATVVSMPFRVLGQVFPATGDTPLVLVGAPLHFAGQVAEFPFYAIGSAFGAPPHIVY